MVTLDELKRLLPQCLIFDQVRIGSSLAVLLRQRPPAPELEREVARLMGLAQDSMLRLQLRLDSRPHVQYPPDLPVSKRKDDVLAALRDHRVVVIAGETGSGKTTQIPKMCLDAGLGVRGRIGCTQPRRVAATSVSRRVAEELGVRWGREVGCKIRFQDETAPETLIKFMTDGILLAEVQGDPFLSEYEVLVVDEAHERSLNIDFLLGHLRSLIEQRPDLKLIITSATIDTARFSEAFGGAPIIEVSGRVYPVDVRYFPLDEMAEELGEATYIDAAAAAVEQAWLESDTGDLLVFLPGERDIRELRDLLETRGVTGMEVLPLFGRLSGADQQRVFAPSAQRKLVLATNIAETSITIPGIRYVIDAGLARISRYNPRTRTKRLPIEPVSRSSADQRKGRAGRVEAGVCIRLYSEEDYQARPAFTQPEIQRSNLAEVILRLKAARLGDVETFPFLDPPSHAAIRAGYDLLRELGALDENRVLTSLGRDLARLPVDPAIGRMILQGHEEKALADVLVIAAGLSIQDPRERPPDTADAAAAAHRRFQHAHSDFLTLLNLWNAFHDQWEQLRTQSQLRKFCRANFLSYLRMREWTDIHQQLVHAAEDVGLGDETRPAESGGKALDSVTHLKPDDARYRAVHRSILAGLLGHVAQRMERNQYRATGNRQPMVFPGSALFLQAVPAARKNARDKDVRGDGQGKSREAEKAVQPAWIVAGEIVETSRLFVRTIAGVDPQWVVELGAHLIKRQYDEPRWNPGAGQVTARERILFQGLEMVQRQVAYGSVQPREAKEMFVRAALVEEGLVADAGPDQEPGDASRRNPNQPRPRWQVHDSRFLEHNRAVRQRVEAWQTQTRKHGLRDMDQALFDFYCRVLPDLSSVADFNRWQREQMGVNPRALYAAETDFTGGEALVFDEALFPKQVVQAEETGKVLYRYAPGEEMDGATVQFPLQMWPKLSESDLMWCIPGLREEMILHLFRELPKALRRDLQPFPAKVTEMSAQIRPGREPLGETFSRFVWEKYQVRVPADAWAWDSLPAHLRVRVELTGPKGQVLAGSRQWKDLETRLSAEQGRSWEESWERAAARFEKHGLREWTVGDLPDHVEVKEGSHWSAVGFPGLQMQDGEVCLRLFRTPTESAFHTPAGWQRLLELALSRDLVWVEKDLRALDRYQVLHATLGPGSDLREGALHCLLRQASSGRVELRAAAFHTAVEQARAWLRTAVPPFVELVGQILQRRQELLVLKKPYPELRRDLDRLIPARFLEKIPFLALKEYPRFLRGMQIRAERAAMNGVKDVEKARQVEPFLQAWVRYEQAGRGAEPAVQALRWLIEEFKVSLFAQELGTATPVSAKRLTAAVEACDAAAPAKR